MCRNFFKARVLKWRLEKKIMYTNFKLYVARGLLSGMFEDAEIAVELTKVEEKVSVHSAAYEKETVILQLMLISYQGSLNNM